MRRFKSGPEQGSLAFEPAQEPKPPEAPPAAPEPVVTPPGRTLDARGHFWWASFARASEEHCIGAALRGTPAWAEEYAAISKVWKEFAVAHEAKGNCLEEA